MCSVDGMGVYVSVVWVYVWYGCVCVNVCGMGVGDVDVWVIWVYGWCGCIGSMRVCV